MNPGSTRVQRSASTWNKANTVLTASIHIENHANVPMILFLEILSRREEVEVLRVAVRMAVQ